jgi:hypothetical protein
MSCIGSIYAGYKCKVEKGRPQPANTSCFVAIGYKCKVEKGRPQPTNTGFSVAM